MENADQKLIDSVIAAQNGNRDAFTYIYESTFKYEYNMAMKMMNYNEADAQDALQVAYIKAFNNIHTLKDVSSFKAWLSMIVRNTIRNELQKNQPLLFSELESEDGDGEVLEYQIEDEKVDSNPEVAYTKQETADMVRELLEDLSPEQKMAIIMFHFEGYSIKDIAETMGCNENTVKSRLNLGRKNLKESCEKLRKKGYKLYSFSPLTLLLLLLRRDVENESVGFAMAMEEGAKQLLGTNPSAAGAGNPGAGAGSGVTSGNAGAGAVGGAANPAGAAVGAKVASGAGIGLKIGLAAAAVVTILAVGATAVIMNNQKNKGPKNTEDLAGYEVSQENTLDNIGSTEDGQDDETAAENPNFNEVLGFDTTEYKKVLADHEEDIKAYDWQGFRDNDDRQIAFTDLNYDGIPEMIVMRTDISNPNPQGTDPDHTAFLEIYSTDAEGNCIKCEFEGVSKITDKMANYAFVQTTDGDLYLIKDYTKSGGTGDVVAVTEHTLITVGDGIAFFEECLYWENDFTSTAQLDKISTKNVFGTCSEEEYTKLKADLESRVDRVIMAKRCDRFDYFVNCGATDLSMTWEDACAYLETGEWSKEEKNSTLTFDRFVTLSDGEVFVHGRNGIEFANEKMYVISAPYEEQVEVKEITKVDDFTYSIRYQEDSKEKELTLYLPGKDISEIPAEEMALLNKFQRDIWCMGFTFDLSGNKLHGYMGIYSNANGKVCAMTCPY